MRAHVFFLLVTLRFSLLDAQPPSHSVECPYLALLPLKRGRQGTKLSWGPKHKCRIDVFNRLHFDPLNQQAQPPDFRQVFWREMQESPHGFDRALQYLQH
jgi:hypothetical protein